MGLAVEVGMLADLLDNDEEGAEWLRISGEGERRSRRIGPTCDLEPESLPPLDDRSIIGAFHILSCIACDGRTARWKQNPEALGDTMPERSGSRVRSRH